MDSSRIGLLTVIALGLGLVTSAANAIVVATWADSVTQSFSFVDNAINNDGIGELSASNSDIILDLPVLGLTGLDASYLMTDTFGNALATTSQIDNLLGFVEAVYEAGKIVITSDIDQGSFIAGDILLTITFDSAIGILGNALANDDLVGQNVTFTGPALGGLAVASSEQFQFSAANVTPPEAILNPADMEAWTATTSFTSSATLVPVPPAVWLFGSGLLGLVGIARRKAV